jgi:hypothetical protein
MFPFQPNPGWYEKHWYSQKPVKEGWRVTSVVASFAALTLTIWLG